MKKMELAGGRICACIFNIIIFTLIIPRAAQAVEHVSHHGSAESAQSACIAAGSALTDSYGGPLCQTESLYGYRRSSFSYCSVGDRRTGCWYGTDIHRFTFPIEYDESVADQVYANNLDAHRACSAFLSAKIGHPNQRCRGMRAWNDNQGATVGLGTIVSGYVLYLHPQTTPSWVGYSCDNLYSWHNTITWCQQNNFIAYFGGCPAGTEPDPAEFNRCKTVAEDPYPNNGNPCTGEDAPGGGIRLTSAGEERAGVGNPLPCGYRQQVPGRSGLPG